MPKKKKNKTSRKQVYILVALIILAFLVAGYLWHRYVHKSATITSTNRTIYSKPVPNPNVPGGNTSTAGGGISSNKGGSSSTPSVSSGTQPTAPVGEFISDHSPNLSGSPHPSSENSTCTTTPGVQCKITFTMGSTVLSLPTQTTDGNGNTSWNWTLQGVGLTAGTWKVTATASNGSKVASTTDSENLVVSQ